MDFEHSPAQDAWRREFRDWLATNLPPDLCLDDAADDRVASDLETFERRRAWQRTMHAAGWVGIGWPQEYGGRGAGLIERVIWEEEYGGHERDPAQHHRRARARPAEGLTRIHRPLPSRAVSPRVLHTVIDSSDRAA